MSFPEEVLPRLSEIDVGDPFEIHVRLRSMLEAYGRRTHHIRDHEHTDVARVSMPALRERAEEIYLRARIDL